MDGGGGSATQVASDDVEADGQGQARLVPPRGAEVEDKLQTTLGEVNQFLVDHHPGIDLPGQDGIGDPVVRPCDEGGAGAVQLRQAAAGGVRVGHRHSAAFQVLGRVEALRDQHGAIAAPHAAAGRQNPVAVRDGGEGDGGDIHHVVRPPGCGAVQLADVVAVEASPPAGDRDVAVLPGVEVEYVIAVRRAGDIQHARRHPARLAKG